ncbi:MAG TPA: hypothetical protein VME01_07160 [Solirubrobacteraceae bacterium]|nr:hypothetical protein [Solirubrobacteraceae bacterium]
MAVEVAPISDTDVPVIAEIMHAHFDRRVPWARSYMALPWQVDAPNRGFMLRDGERVVGAYLAFYSQRLMPGRVESFCNLGAWCVLPEYRLHSVRLLKALIAQRGYHFTDLSPNKTVTSVNAKLSFRYLDTSAAFVPHLPWPTSPGRTRITTDGAAIARLLEEPHLEVYRDHAQAAAAHHLVISRGDASCYVMYREVRYRNVPILAVILYVSDPSLFRRAIFPLTRYLLVRRRLLATLAELRIVTYQPPLSFRLRSWPKMYRSATLEPHEIDDLYSELVCVPW